MSAARPAAAARHRSRGRWPVLAVGLAMMAGGVKLTTMFWFSNQGAAAYADGSYRRSRVEFGRLDVANVIEPWRVPFGLGAARYRQGDLLGAEAAFAAALELAPERCEIRFNLAVTIEAEGDALLANRAPTVDDIVNLNPLDRYATARDVINVGNCPSTRPDDAGERLAEALERIIAKLGGEGVPSPLLPDGGDPAVADPQPNDDQLRQLDERTQLAAARNDDVSDLNIDGTTRLPRREW